MVIPRQAFRVNISKSYFIKHSSYKNRGAANGRAKLTEEDVLTIRKLHNEGVSNSELYKAYPQVSKTAIRNVINGNTWKNLF